MSISKAYDDHDAVGLAGLVARGEVSAAELLEEALRRAEAAQARFNCVTLAQPETARRRVAEGLPDGPLRGVPFVLKDLGAGAVDFPSNSGSRATAGRAAEQDSNFYARLAAAGLSTFARTPSPEFGVGPATEAAVYGGPTRNPWNPEHTSGGSSGGSAACVAAGVVPAAHASDGAGSIRIPASSSGLYGLKPSRGLMPTGPVAGDGWGGLATNGFLSRTVRDTAALLDATAGGDLGAPHAAPIPSMRFGEAVARPPERLRIGFLRGNLMGERLHPDCVAAVEDAAKLLESLGHEVEEAPLPDADTPEVIRAVALLMACDNAGTFRDLAKAEGVAPEALDLEPIAKGALRVGSDVDGAEVIAGIELVHRYGRKLARW
ncbi:MAG: amidase, partial [Pseudomonadota bacterium]